MRITLGGGRKRTKPLLARANSSILNALKSPPLSPRRTSPPRRHTPAHPHGGHFRSPQRAVRGVCAWYAPPAGELSRTVGRRCIPSPQRLQFATPSAPWGGRTRRPRRESRRQRFSAPTEPPRALDGRTHHPPHPAARMTPSGRRAATHCTPLQRAADCTPAQHPNAGAQLGAERVCPGVPSRSPRGGPRRVDTAPKPRAPRKAPQRARAAMVAGDTERREATPHRPRRTPTTAALLYGSQR